MDTVKLISEAVEEVEYITEEKERWKELQDSWYLYAR